MTNRFGFAEVKVVPTPYAPVVELLNSGALQVVEDEIARQVGMPINRDMSSAVTSYIQAEMSVSGLTAAGIEQLLCDHRKEIVEFGVCLLSDADATMDEGEFPEGEEPEHSQVVERCGLAAGFGIKYAIYFNFLVNRSRAEFHAFLQNRRIPKHAKFAKELERLLPPRVIQESVD
jgi:hypothetical protein